MMYLFTVMTKLRVKRIRRISALGIFTTGLMSFLTAAGLSWADSPVPIPAKKPVFEAVEPKGEVVKYSLGDFSKVLLDFGAPEVPKPRPFVEADKPVNDETAALYKKIFELQEEGNIKDANREMAKLTDMRLRGHILFQRYMHPTAYTSSFDELANWMSLYADHPQATKVYKLALKKMPDDFNGEIMQPVRVRGVARVRDPMLYAGMTYKPTKTRDAEEKKKAAEFRKLVEAKVYKGNPSQAYEMLQGDERVNLLDNVEFDILRAHVAAGYLYNGKTDMAHALAAASAKRSGIHVPQAGWVAGLVSWKRKSYKEAAKYFEITARSPYASGWMASGGSYWAARSHMRTGNVRAVSTWLKRGMEHPRTFYGLLSTRALGRNFDFDWHVPRFTDESRKLLEDVPEGQRAMALVAAGQPHLAEAELLRINPGKDDALRNALFAYAGYADLPALGLRLGTAISGPDGYYDAALYPAGAWKPKEGFRIDPALIHGIIRQESRFDPTAESPSGAMGLMQLLPSTARYVAGSRKAKNLTDPETNLEIGQAYIDYLLNDKSVQGDLAALLVAYNAGPGNLAKWKKRQGVQDPLLFIEMIPSRETRIYVERVLANYWIYRMRDGQPTPTMDAMAAGRVAKYADGGYAAPYKVAASR